MVKIIEKIKNLFSGKKVKKEESKLQSGGPKKEEKSKEQK